MMKLKVFPFTLFIIFTFTFGLFISGCSSEATPEQLQKIKELEAEVNSLDQSIKSKESEKSAIERDINGIEAKLKNCESEKQLVRDRLATWKEPVQQPVEKPVEKNTPKKKKTK